MVKKIVVCGAGTMGSGIAQVCAQYSYRVVLFDLFAEALEKAHSRIDKSLQYLVDKNKISTQGKQEIINSIKFTGDVNECLGDVVIEAVAEKEDIKIKLLNQLARLNGDRTILASNTSSISISDIQQHVPGPERISGMHFFNPPYIMKLVEIVRGLQTSDITVQTLKELALGLKKQPVICRDSPGFIVNRVARPYYLEAMRLCERGAATVKGIDAIMESCGFRMGPFRLMDLIGNDINLATSRIVYKDLGNPERLRPIQMQADKVNSGDLGKKTGKGFYQY